MSEKADSADMMERFCESVWLYLAATVLATFATLSLAKLMGISFDILPMWQKVLMIMFFFPVFRPPLQQLQAALKKYLES